MKKSLFTFGLLASSLVMLAIMPFLNNNAAIAQGYGNYYGDNGYSKYPTDDKKYECQTGSFEGFFVSSVEFCKHIKIDDRKDHSRDTNRTGTQGLPGPQGPSGPQGPQGIQGERGFNGTAGPTQILPGVLYEVFGPAFTTGDVWNSFVQSEAVCDPGDIVFNGESFVSPLTNSSVLTGISSFEIPGSNHGGWIVQVQGIGIHMFANAICFDNPPLRP